MKLLSQLFLTGLLFSTLTIANNLGTINSIRNGFGTVNECTKAQEFKNDCNDESLEDIKELLNFTTTSQCIASMQDYKDSGIEIPTCPKNSDQIKGLDNTHPTGGIFALYTGNNDAFIEDLTKSVLNGTDIAKFNLVLPRSRIKFLKENKSLLKLLNQKRVNIINVETMPSVERWMQDSFQFTTIDSKPALLQLDHHSEQGERFENRFACDLAKSCDIPYYIPPDMIDPLNQEASSLNSGGNLEVLPGGTILTGTAQSKGFNNHARDRDIPFRTKFQEKQKKSFEESGNKVLEIDTSFLSVGHVDEIFNFVKTNNPAPCDYAVMVANPKLAFSIMEETAHKLKLSKKNQQSFFSKFLFSNVYAAGLKKLKKHNICKDVSYNVLKRTGFTGPIPESQIQKIEENFCIDYFGIEDFVSSPDYLIYKRENLTSADPSNIQSIMDKNKELVLQELKDSTGCKNPVVIDIPVFFDDGLSFTPDLVNGVVQTPPNEASNIILPRSYFKPFDDYVKRELRKHGVFVSMTHDMGYHLAQGEVHCGTNSARICKP